MAIRTYDISITQGDDYSVTLYFKDTDGAAIDMTGCTARAYIKTTPSSATITAQFTLGLTNLATGQIVMSLTDEISSTLKITRDDASNIYYWDLEVIYPGDLVKTELGGTLTILEQVTF